MAASIICNRAFAFACRTLKLTDQIWCRGPGARHVASQLMKSGTSIGSNAEEAQEAQSKADFIARLSISRKEARETIWWLRVAVTAAIVTSDEIAWDLNEAQQLLAMIKAAIRTARRSHDRGGGD